MNANKSLTIRNLSILLLLLLATSVAFSMYLPSGETTTKAITKNVYTISNGGFTSLVVIGDKGVLVTEPAHPIHAKMLKQAIKRLTPLPVTHVFLTHEHYDHIAGASAFEDATVIVQENAVPIFDLDVMGFAPSNKIETFDKEYSLTMGPTEVKALHFGAPSDGFANAVLYLPKEELVYSADLYENNALTDAKYIDAINTLGIRKFLNEMVALNPKYAITSHSQETNVENLKRATDLYNDLYEVTLTGLKAAYEENGNAGIIEFTEVFPKQVKLEKYKDFKNYDHLYRHAERMIESIVHGG